MGQFFQSRNNQVTFPGSSGRQRLGSVQYTGPSSRNAVVVWDARFDQLSPTPINILGMCFRTDGVAGQLLFRMHEIHTISGQTYGRVSGAVITDLEPGQVLDLVGFVDDPGALAFQADGLRVWVL